MPDLGPLYENEYTKNLKLQKRAARIILNVDITTPSQIMFREMKWLISQKEFSIIHVQWSIRH